MTTTDTDPLTERIARALYENAEYYGPAPTQPPWDWRDDEERGEWTEVAAAVLPIVAVEVRKAKAEALDEFAQWAESLNDKHPRFKAANDLAADMAKRFKADNYPHDEAGDRDEHR